MRIALLITTATLSALGTAQATILAPFNPGALPDLFPPISGALVASNQQPFTTFGQVQASGSLSTWVYRDPDNTFGAGDLDFVYQFTVSQYLSNAMIAVMSATDFTGFATDVGFVPNTGLVSPMVVDRLDPSSVGFVFGTLVAGVPVAAPMYDLVIETNATSFDDKGSVTFFGPASLTNTFEPATVSAVIPEPSTWMLMGLGFGLLGSAGYRKAAARLAERSTSLI
jgi:hypothetical protein